MDFTIAIVLGVFGSLHCAAMCGPLLLALPVSPRAVPGGLSPAALFYQSGPRDETHCLLGLDNTVFVGKSMFSGGLATLAVHCRWAWRFWLGFSLSKKIAVSAPHSPVGRTVKAAMGSLNCGSPGFRSLSSCWAS